LEKDFVIDFVAEVSDKDMEVIGSILFVVTVRLVGPVDTDFLVVSV
jgi:hypothetical protein